MIDYACNLQSNEESFKDYVPIGHSPENNTHTYTKKNDEFFKLHSIYVFRMDFRVPCKSRRADRCEKACIK